MSNIIAIVKQGLIVPQKIVDCLLSDTSCLLCLVSTRGALLCVPCEAGLPYLSEKSSKMRVLFAYEPPVEQFIVALKFRQALYFARWFAQKMIERWERPSVDCILPVPLHPRRQRERGFNQTLEIAKYVASHWGIPLDTRSCTRVRYRQPQAALSAHLRKSNVTASSFKITAALRGKRVLVIEDVITTGSTIVALLTALQRGGVKETIVWACCQAIKHTSNR